MREIVGRFLPWGKRRGRIAGIERRRGSTKGAIDKEGRGAHLPSPVLNLISNHIFLHLYIQVNVRQDSWLPRTWYDPNGSVPVV